ncbi:MAG TPA: hypothetical protein VF735_21090 [Pyrinomonadaceae bacterium]|jgi:hypothetical protein
MIIKRFVCLLVFSLAVITSAAAQPAAPAPAEQGEAQATPEQQKAQQELERKALALLDEIIADTKALKSPENRILIKVAVADLLWPRNEARARTLYKEAANNFTEVLTADGDAGAMDVQFTDNSTELRRALIQSIARHDPQWARDILRSTRPAAAAQPAGGHAPGSERELQLEQSIASQIAASDPKQALELAEQTLSKGVSYELLNTVSLLMRKDREAAARLSSKIVTKLQTENLATNEEALNAAFRLLTMLSRNPESALSKTSATSQPAILTQQELRDLTEMIVTGALNSTSNNSYKIIMLRPLLPEIERYAPARIAQVRSRLAEAVKREERNGGMSGELQEIMQNGTVDAILEAAPKAPEMIRNHIYLSAAMKAVEQGDSDRARQIIEDNASDPAQRKYMMADIERMMMMKAAAEGNMELTRQMLSRLRTNEERVMALTQLATVASTKGDKKAALALLDEARSMVGSRAKNFAQLGAQLQVARGYARLDPARSLLILEPMIDQLNELVGAGALLGGFFSEQFVKDDEIQLHVMNSVTGGLAGEFAVEFKALASADFDRTKAAADRFQRSEIRVMARLMIAQSILAPPGPQGSPRIVPGGTGIMLGASPAILVGEP